MKLVENLVDLGARRVLLADPSRMYRCYQRTMLLQLGARHFLEASDGAEALELFELNEPEIVVLADDLSLVNGVEFVRLMRRSGKPGARLASAVITTVAPSRTLVYAARNAGADELLVKPFSLRRMAERMASVTLFRRPFVDSAVYTGPCRRRLKRPRPGPERRGEAARQLETVDL